MPVKALSLRPWRAFRIALGFVLVVLGAVTAPTPVPIGLAMLGAGIAVLLVESRVARRALYAVRYRFPGLPRRLATAATRLPARMRRVLERTDPWRR